MTEITLSANTLLPTSIKNALQADNDDNWQNVVDVLSTLESNEYADAKLVGKCLRLMTTRLTLKYFTTVSKFSYFVNSLLTLYSTRSIAIPMKIKLLEILTRILKLKRKVLDIKVSIYPFWNETIAICTRKSKDISISCETMNSKLFENLLFFTHEIRHYISDEEAKSILATGFSDLSDLRTSECVLGLQKLVTCLPSTMNHTYGVTASKWIDLLSAISYNEAWSASCLTLLSRVRFQKEEQNTLINAIPLLLSKLKELLQLPTVKARISIGNELSTYLFPPHLLALKTSNVDYKKTALKKIAKLLCSLSFTGNMTVGECLSVTPPIQILEETVYGLNIPCAEVHVNAIKVIQFMQSIRVYLNPSNTGNFGVDLSYFMNCFIAELCKMIANKIWYTMNGTVKSDFSLHEDTVKYLSGCFCSFVLENLYAKNPFITQQNISTLKNLCSIQPSLGKVIVPCLLLALRSESVNQSHMAPTALMALTSCLKPLFYPNPILFSYLPEILQLSIAGVDPNDTRKSSTALMMYITLLNWCPKNLICSTEEIEVVAERLLFHYQQTNVSNEYLDITNGKGNLESKPYGSDYENNQTLILTNVVQALSAWSQQLLENMFGLLKTKEIPQKAKNGSASWGLSSYFIETFEMLVRLMTKERRNEVINQVLDFALENSRENCCKEVGKMLETLCSCDPSLLSLCLSRIADQDVFVGSGSTDKIAYRIFLCGACMRCCGGDAIVTSGVSILHTFGRDLFKLHTDKKIRKSSTKLVKDALRGLCAYYPTSINNNNIHNGECFGVSNSAELSEVTWHIPTFASISYAITLLKEHVTTTMETVKSLLQSNGGNNVVANVKKLEDDVVAHLHVIRGCVRGATELLGDGELAPTELLGDGELALASSSPHSVVTHSHRVVDTGRSVLLTLKVSLEDRVYLETLRYTIVVFLNDVHHQLNVISSNASVAAPVIATATTTTTTTSDSMDVSTDVNSIDVNIPSTPISNSSISSNIFVNNVKVLNICMKIFKVVTIQRMANVKNVDNIMKWFTMLRKIRQSSITSHMIKLIHQQNIDGLQLSNSNAPGYLYWLGHDNSTRTLSDRAWLQYALRQKEFSYVSLRYTTIDSFGSCYITGLSNIIGLCGNIYEDVRSKAKHIFHDVVTRFGSKVEPLMKSMFETIRKPQISYESAIGCLSVLNYLMKRITSQWTHYQQFFECLYISPSIIASIPELDKSTKLAERFSDLFVSFLRHWHHLPLGYHTNDIIANKKEVNGLLQLLAQTSGVDMSDVTSTCLSNNNSGGLRYRLQLASGMLCLLGHSDVDISEATWRWAVGVIRSGYGQPEQLLGLSALTKMAYLQCQQFQLSSKCVGTTTSTSTSPSCFVVPDDIWSPLVLAMMHGRPLNEGVNAQWSSGIDVMIKNAEYIRGVIPRANTRSPDARSFSGLYKHQNSYMLQCLIELYLNNVSHNNNGQYVKSLSLIIQDILLACKNIHAAGELEERALNTVRSEVFGGLLRLLYDNKTFGMDIFEEAELLLLNFFSEHITKISLEYCYDWAESVAYGFSNGCTPIDPANKTVAYIIKTLHDTCSSSSSSSGYSVATSTDSGEGGGEGSEGGNSNTNSNTSSSSSSNISEGFTKVAKSLVLVNAIVCADILTVTSNLSASSATDPKSVLGEILIPIFIQYDKILLSSPYRTVRLESGSLLGILGYCCVPTDMMVEGDDIPSSSCLIFQQVLDKMFGDVISQDGSNNLITISIQQYFPPNDLDTSEIVQIWKNKVETCSVWLQKILKSATWFISKYRVIVQQLLCITLEGSGHFDLQLSKNCHGSCLLTAQSLARGIYSNNSSVGSNDTNCDILYIVLKTIQLYVNHKALHIRETVQLCCSIILFHALNMLTISELKICRDVFNSAFEDSKPEVQILARGGMTVYLLSKTLSELKTLAVAYTKNNDVFAAREKKKRKQQNETAGLTNSTINDKPETVHIVTVMMSSCILMLFPYDLPEFVPALLTSFVRHGTIPYLKDTVMRTVQEFKRTHQDRWNDFKTSFTQDQLDDIQGAGAAHYFS